MNGRIESFLIDSAALADNPLGDPAQRLVSVYLPPDYDRNQARRFPTVMLLPGFASTGASFLAARSWAPTLPERFERLLTQELCSPAVLIFPDVMTRWGGSQFVDSPAVGRYQSYLAEEIWPAVDQRFRTIPSRQGRAVVGKSSGGFGALTLALDRPELLSAVGSHAGDCAFELSLRPELARAALIYEAAGGVPAFIEGFEGSERKSADAFTGIMVLACGAAYAPAMNAPFPHVQWPMHPHTAELDPAIWSTWLRHDPLHRLRQDGGQGLSAMARIFIDAGLRDEHHLQQGARSVVHELRQAGLEVEHEEFPDGHRDTAYRYERSLPVLIAALDPGS